MASKDLVAIETPTEAMEAMRGNIVVKIEDTEDVSRRIMESILESDSVDDILGQQIAIHAQDIVGRPFTLNGAKFLKSKFDKGLPVFAVMDCTFLDDGSSGAVTTSMRNVCAQIAALWNVGALPIDVKIYRSDEPTANGYYVYRLERA